MGVMVVPLTPWGSKYKRLGVMIVGRSFHSDSLRGAISRKMPWDDLRQTSEFGGLSLSSLLEWLRL
jgi:hypothetical protein